MDRKLILASQSPRRRELLQMLHLPFDVLLPEFDEEGFDETHPPAEYCCILSRLKARSVMRRFPNDVVIGADTIVVLDSEIIEKPADKSEAVVMLEKLSGKTHQVITGVSLQCADAGIDHTFFEKTDVRFALLTSSEIHYYIDHQPPYDKAGSYGIQDWSVVFVEGIQGCYNNVVGFPVFRFYQELKKLGLYNTGQ